MKLAVIEGRVYKGQTTTIFIPCDISQFCPGIYLEDATVLQLHILKPDQTEAVWNPVIHSVPGYLKYCTLPDVDLNLSGQYYVQPALEFPGIFQGRTTTVSFRVEEDWR